VGQVYSKKDLINAQMAVIAKTKMVEYEMEFFTELTGQKEMPAEMKGRHDAVLKDWSEYAHECGNLLALVDEPTNEDGSKAGPAPMVELQKNGNFNASYLLANHEVDAENITALYHWAKFRFECGNYGEARVYLEAFRALSTEQASLNSSLWGKFAADMLMQDWQVAIEDIGALRSMMDAKRADKTALVTLQERTWLMHWGLFAFFNHAQGRAELIDLYLNEHYLNAITTNAPHLLRYLCVAMPPPPPTHPRGGVG
jgi:translation initiation factor 3 subunit E